MQAAHGWADYLHTSFSGEHILFPDLRLTSFPSFIIAAALSASICLAERALTFAVSRRWIPFRSVRHSRARSALWQAWLYSLATLLRLLYMILSMTFHVWLIFIIVVSLAVGQFFVEYYDQPRSDHTYQQLTCSPSSSPPPPPPRRMRRATRCKTKPAGLFIHPNDSNIARADTIAIQLASLRSEPKTLQTSSDTDDGWRMWGHGRGRMAARALLGDSRQQSPPSRRRTSTSRSTHSRSDSQQPFIQAGEDSRSESSD